MRKTVITISLCFLCMLLSVTALAQDEEPSVVSALEGQIPEDAIILFDGTDLSEWTFTDGRPANWDISNGEITIQRGGGIITKRTFGDIQLHIEFRTPSPARGEGQDRGNSGVYFHGAYEVQVLDSYESKTYTNGQCGAIYEQYPPLVNVSRPPGVWQTYDIIFRAANFDSNRKMTVKPRITVIHNGILIQDHVEINGTTRAAINEIEKPTGPIYLQDHNHPVKYRNIWVREL
ncbi:DUF1080 domain-containing protein [Candidatus Latescibacterota bacterium]